MLKKEQEYSPTRADWKVPAGTFTKLADRSSKYVIVTPVINENGRLQKQLQNIRALNLSLDIIICDGGSTDGCDDADVLTELGVTTLLRKTGAGKMSAQLRLGLAFAMDQGYEGVICMDGNGKDGVDGLRVFMQKLDEGYDSILGSRYAKGGVEFNTPFERKWGIKLIHAPIVSLAARRWMSDTTNGFRSFSRNYLLDSRVQPFRDVFMIYNLPYYLAVRAPQLKLKWIEIPVVRGYPKDEPIPSKIHGFGSKWGIMVELYETLTGKYNPT